MLFASMVCTYESELQAQAQIAAQAQEKMANKLQTICFERCVPKPEERLTDRQRRCLEHCGAAFIEGFSVASDAAGALLKREVAKRGH